jgi:hypothetical protein
MSMLKHVLVAIGSPRPTVLLLVYVKHILASMTGNAWFTSLPAAFAALQADVAALDAAQTVTKNRAPGAAAARNTKQAALLVDLRTLKAYVQSVADAAGPELAQTIIESAGMTVKLVVHAPKPPLAAKMGKSTGNVNLRAKAVGKRAAYEWAYSLDMGKTWVALPVTDAAHTSVSGLTAGTTYLFRFRGTMRAVAGDWSQVVSLLVH